MNPCQPSTTSVHLTSIRLKWHLVWIRHDRKFDTANCDEDISLLYKLFYRLFYTIGGWAQIAIVEDLHGRGVAFRSLTEQLETASAGGRLIFQIFGALAEFERALIRERTIAGLAAARARGRKGGRRPKLNTKDVREMRALYKEGSTPIADIAKRFGIGRSTVYRSLAKSTSQKAR